MYLSQNYEHFGEPIDNRYITYLLSFKGHSESYQHLVAQNRCKISFGPFLYVGFRANLIGQ